MSCCSESCVELEYFGHSCFAVKWQGCTVVLDPHDGASIGLQRPSASADAVLVTHEHFDHNAVEVVAKERSQVVKELSGAASLKLCGKEVLVEGFRAPHDRVGGKHRGLTTIYRLRFGDTVVIHAGDLGAVLGEELLRELSQPRPDFLMLPVGGVFTIEPYEAWKVAELVNPCYVVPMHYWVPGSTLPLRPVQDFFLFAKSGRVEVEGAFSYCKAECEWQRPKILFLKRPSKAI